MEHWVGQATLSREQLLAHAGLLVEYTRAEGDRLYMDDGHGGEVAVLDLVGGFGSTLLGHHHPEIRSVLRSCLDAQRPAFVQGSQRRFAADLKETLAGYLHQHTGRDYRISLLSTGTEAVEAALKHANLAYAKRVTRIADELAANLRALHTRIERGEESVDEDFLRSCESPLGQEPLGNLDELLAALAAHNQRVLNAEPFVAGFEYAFHGKTMGSLAVTWNRDARLPFLRNNPHAVFITEPSAFLDTVERRSQTYYEFAFEPLRLQPRRLLTLSALIYEPLQGEGGVIELDEDQATLLRNVQQRHPEVALIADEIQCGLGRTGRPVESQARGLPNDYLTFSKSLGGGIAKVSALAVRADRYIPEFGLLHTSTFAEDDLSSAVAKRTLEIIQRDGLARRCAEVGDAFLEGLQALQRRWPRVLKAVRGRGCMLGIEFEDLSAHPSAVLSGLAEEKLLGIVCAGYLLHEHRVRLLPSMGRRGVLRIQPSAYLQPADMQHTIRALQALLEVLDRGDAAALLAFLAGGDAAAAGAAAAAQPARDAGSAQPVERVGFIAHLIDMDSIRQWDPSLAGFSDDQLGELRTQMQPVMEPRTIARRRIRSALGREVELVLYGVLMDSESIATDMRFNKSEVIRRHVRSAYRQARLDGCSLVGFGGYTSIVTANCTDFDDEHPAVTTGNALTVATSIASMRVAARKHGIVLSAAHVAIVGAAGNIGHVHATLLA
ncbi:partial [LysW]-aminoadipate semialdehyde transaminase, partial [Burkholderiaceae bacterium]